MMPPRRIVQPVELTPDHKKVMRAMAHMARDLDAVYRKYEGLSNRMQPEIASIVLRSKASGIKQVSTGLKNDIEMMKRKGWQGQQ
jgi:hypothetical protein